MSDKQRMFLRVVEAAEKLGITRQRVGVLIRGGRIPAEKYGHDWLILPADLELFIAVERKPGRPANAVSARQAPAPPPADPADESLMRITFAARCAMEPRARMDLIVRMARQPYRVEYCQPRGYEARRHGHYTDGCWIVVTHMAEFAAGPYEMEHQAITQAVRMAVEPKETIESEAVTEGVI